MLVYSTDGQRTLQASVLTPELEAVARSADGVGAAGRIGQGTFTVTAGGDIAEASIIGYETVGLGSPGGPQRGPAPARVPARPWPAPRTPRAGFDVGDVVTIEPAGAALTSSGSPRTPSSTSDRRCSSPTTATSPPSRRGTRTPARRCRTRSASPRSRAPPRRRSSASIDATSDDLDALTRDQAADDAPGVAQVRQSFQVIFLLYALVVPFVTGLFFLIITVQKAGALTLLRAIGAPGRRLVAALLVQVVIIVGLGLVVGIALYTPLTIVSATALGLRFETAAVVGWSVLLLALGLLSSLLRGAAGAGDRSRDGHHRGGSAMKLALRELRRRPGRFVTATIILTLVAVLVMFLGGLLDGLIRSSTDAVRAQDGDLIVYSSTSQSSFLRSRIDADTRATIDAVPGVAADRRHRPRPARRPGPGQRAARSRRDRPVRLRAGTRSVCPTHRRPARSTPTTCCAPTASRWAWRSSSVPPARR